MHLSEILAIFVRRMAARCLRAGERSGTLEIIDMIVTQIDIENFRGIAKATITPHARMNLLMGNNGAGKTSVLKALSILLSWLVARVSASNGKGNTIDNDDIRNGSHGCYLRLMLDVCTQGWALYRSARGHANVAERKTALAPLSTLVRAIQVDMQHRLPLVAYYPVTRSVLDIPLRIKGKHVFDTLAAYDGALDEGRTNFRRFFEWFRQREDLENETLRRANTSGTRFTPDPQLQAVRDAAQRIFPQLSDLQVRRAPLAMVLKKDGEEMKINQLSDGEKCFIALVADLARRLAMANPEAEKPLEGEGIVLIDEVDLHLHPQWQMMVVDCLMEVFPHCQFFLSTHSPYVASHVRQGKIFRLDHRDGITSVEESELAYGAQPATIYTKIMGMDRTRPNDVEDLFASAYRLAGNNQLDEARAKLDELTALMPDDPDVLLLDGYLTRKALIGR